MTSRDFRERLSRRAKRAGVQTTPELVKALETYYRLLSTWNARINLAGMDLSEPTNEAFDRLLVEPLAAAAHCELKRPRMLDAGSGGGSPAVPMTLALEGSSLVMVESKVRKSVFLREVCRELGLTRAEVVNARFEELLTRPDLHEAADLVTVRAVRVDPKVLNTLQAFLRPGGQMFLFRGPAVTQAESAVSPPLSQRAVYPLLESLRSQLVVLEKKR